MAEPTLLAVDALGEVLEELERVEDHPARLGRGVVLADAGRALPGAAGRDRALVDDDHVAHAAPGQVERGAGSGHAAADDHHVRAAGRRHAPNTTPGPSPPSAPGPCTSGSTA